MAQKVSNFHTMKHISPLLSSRLALIAALLVQVGCSFQMEEQDEDLGIVQQMTMTENSLTENGLTTNGLTTNGLTTNGLTTNGLTTNGLVMSELEENAAAPLFLKYVVSCALPAGQSLSLVINGARTVFYGQLGLAPEWASDTGYCDATCRAWMSACILARVNYLGVTVPLSMRGPTPVLASSSGERTAYPLSEATYYGDIFTSPQQRFACRTPGSSLISRVCGGDGIDTTGCVVDVVDTCDNVCNYLDPVEGYYQNCKDRLNNVHPISVSVFRLPPPPSLE